MRSIVIFLFTVASIVFPSLLCPSMAFGQYTRTRTRQTQPNGTAIAGAYNEPAATMHGILKKITKKDVIIVSEGDQVVTMDRTHKTKFFKDGKEIKPEEIAEGSVVSVDVGKDPQLTPLALNVMVNAPPIDEKTAQATQKPVKKDENPNIPEEDSSLNSK